MDYVIAGYASAIGPVVIYLVHLVRERRRLLQELAKAGVRPI